MFAMEAKYHNAIAKNMPSNEGGLSDAR